MTFNIHKLRIGDKLTLRAERDLYVSGKPFVDEESSTETSKTIYILPVKKLELPYEYHYLFCEKLGWFGDLKDNWSVILVNGRKSQVTKFSPAYERNITKFLKG